MDRPRFELGSRDVKPACRRVSVRSIARTTHCRLALLREQHHHNACGPFQVSRSRSVVADSLRGDVLRVAEFFGH